LANHKQELPLVAMEILHRLKGFKEDFFLEIGQPETKTAYGGHFC
jgi:hypothetical protein